MQDLFLYSFWRLLLCADEKLEWSRELFLDSEPQPLYMNSRARNGRRSDDYQRDLSIRIMRRFTRKTRGWNRECAGKILTPNHSCSSQCAARFVARNHAATQFTAETI